MQSFKNPFPNINLKSISTKEIENMIKSFKPKNSFGYDGISTKLLKNVPPLLAQLCPTYVTNPYIQEFF